MRGRLDQCRHCGHRRSAHTAGPARPLCDQVLSCHCIGFAPSHLTWDVFYAAGEWAVQSRHTGSTWAGLPTEAAATQLAQTLTDIDDMLGQRTVEVLA